EHGRLSVDVNTLADDSDLYKAGMTSHASVNVMLALEGAFDVEFPDRLLKRGVFESIGSIAGALEELTAAALPRRAVRHGVRRAAPFVHDQHRSLGEAHRAERSEAKNGERSSERRKTRARRARPRAHARGSPNRPRRRGARGRERRPGGPLPDR